MLTGIIQLLQGSPEAPEFCHFIPEHTGIPEVQLEPRTDPGPSNFFLLFHFFLLSSWFPRVTDGQMCLQELREKFAKCGIELKRA